MQTIIDMENIVRQFYEDVSEKISLTYNQELFSVFDNMPSPIINFNDIELLKKAQLYVRHTDRVFNKSVARLIQRLFEKKQIEARTCADWAGRCVYVYPIKTRFHFVAIEKFAGFPHVSWLKEFASSSIKKSTENNIYIRKDETTFYKVPKSLNDLLDEVDFNSSVGVLSFDRTPNGQSSTYIAFDDFNLYYDISTSEMMAKHQIEVVDMIHL